MDMGKPKALAIWDACKEIAFSKLLILFCILAVFAPAFTMGGIPGSLFLPLSLAIAFSMITSYLMAQTFVPCYANWIMKEHNELKNGGSKKLSGKRKLKDARIFSQSGINPESEKNTWQQRDLPENQPEKTRPKTSRFDRFRIRFVRFNKQDAAI